MTANPEEVNSRVPGFTREDVRFLRQCARDEVNGTNGHINQFAADKTNNLADRIESILSGEVVVVPREELEWLQRHMASHIEQREPWQEADREIRRWLSRPSRDTEGGR